MAITAKPEILTPGAPDRPVPRFQKGSAAFSNENLDTLSHLLDDFIRIPGTPIRFGLDGIVGFIPGVGDILGGLASCIIIVAAWVRGVRPVIIARMVLNVAIETGIGSLPFVGNFFDIAWRANRPQLQAAGGDARAATATHGHKLAFYRRGMRCARRVNADPDLSRGMGADPCPRLADAGEPVKSPPEGAACVTLKESGRSAAW